LSHFDCGSRSFAVVQQRGKPSAQRAFSNSSRLR
jgi:hypothetical protein